MVTELSLKKAFLLDRDSDHNIFAPRCYKLIVYPRLSTLTNRLSPFLISAKGTSLVRS